MEGIKIVDAKMPNEVGVKGNSNTNDEQIEKVLDNILCDD